MVASEANGRSADDLSRFDDDGELRVTDEWVSIAGMDD